MNNSFSKYEESIKLSYEHAMRMLLRLKNVEAYFKQIENPDAITREIYRDSIIKKYEMLEEAVWKLLSQIFKGMGLEINNPRGCYKQAFKERWIKDIVIWDEMLLARNSTAHIYEEEDYEHLKVRIEEDYTVAIEELLDQLADYR